MTTWATGWYKVRRHIVGRPLPDGSAQSACQSEAQIYPAGHADRVLGYCIPASNTAEVMAMPACKFCLRDSGGADQRPIQSPPPATTSD